MGRYLVAFLLLFITLSSYSQEFSRKDSLRGNLTPIRNCYDVTFYDLKVMIDEQEKSIERSYNIIHLALIGDVRFVNGLCSMLTIFYTKQQKR